MGRKTFNCTWEAEEVKELDDAVEEWKKEKVPDKPGRARGRAAFLLHLFNLFCAPAPFTIGVRFQTLADRLAAADLQADEAIGETVRLLRSQETEGMKIPEALRFLEALENQMLLGLRKWAAVTLPPEDGMRETLRERHLETVLDYLHQREEREWPDFLTWTALNDWCSTDVWLADIAGVAFVNVLREDFGVPALTLEDPP